MSVCFLRGDRKGVDPDGGYLGEVWGEETVIRTHCMGVNLFSIGKKKKGFAWRCRSLEA